MDVRPLSRSAYLDFSEALGLGPFARRVSVEFSRSVRSSQGERLRCALTIVAGGGGITTDARCVVEGAVQLRLAESY
jgi:hypothetical protein